MRIYNYFWTSSYASYWCLSDQVCFLIVWNILIFVCMMLQSCVQSWRHMQPAAVQFPGIFISNAVAAAILNIDGEWARRSNTYYCTLSWSFCFLAEAHEMYKSFISMINHYCTVLSILGSTSDGAMRTSIAVLEIVYFSSILLCLARNRRPTMHRAFEAEMAVHVDFPVSERVSASGSWGSVASSSCSNSEFNGNSTKQGGVIRDERTFFCSAEANE